VIVVEILLSIAAAASVFCGVMLMVVYQRGEHLAQVLEMQIRALGATHLAGFEALTIEMQKIEQRVKAVEEEVL
jgi:hypothetical protein